MNRGTLVDSNVLLDVLTEDPRWAPRVLDGRVAHLTWERRIVHFRSECIPESGTSSAPNGGRRCRRIVDTHEAKSRLSELIREAEQGHDSPLRRVRGRVRLRMNNPA